MHLGRVLKAVGPHGDQVRIGLRHAEELVARGEERLVTKRAAILEFQVEAGRVAQLLHRRRHHDEDLSVANAGKRGHRPRNGS